MPGARDQLTQRMPQGSVIKCHAVYPEPFWRAEGLTGQAGSDTGPAKVVFDNSPPGGTPGVLLAFLEGRYARELGTWPATDRRAAVLGALTRLFGPRAGTPEAFHEQSWAEEPYTRGCYGAYLGPGVWTVPGPRPAPAGRPAALGGRRVRDRLERLHGRRRALGEDAAAAVLAAAA
jgi:monoamine oxidase